MYLKQALPYAGNNVIEGKTDSLFCHSDIFVCTSDL